MARKLKTKTTRADSIALPGADQLEKVRNDGFANIYTGQGIDGKDKQLGSMYIHDVIYTEEQNAALYRGNGFARRIVDLPASEMVREWFNVVGDTDGVIEKYLHELCAKDIIFKALKWADVFGGSVIVMGIDDGGKLEMPVNYDKIKTVGFLQCYDRHRVQWTTADLYKDPESEYYGQPEFYTIYPMSSIGRTSFRVHTSRVLVFDGLDIPDRKRLENQGWGDSVYQAVFTQLSDLVGAYHAAKSILDDFEQIIININNLQDLIAAGKEDEVKKRLQILDLGRHIMNTVILDGDEKYSKSSSSIHGIDEILSSFAQAVSAVTGIPMTLLMGQSPKGMNSTGESDIRQWYDNISARQESKLLKQLEKLILVISSAADCQVTLEDIVIEFRPLWQPSEKQTVETRRIQAETDKIYYETGVLTPQEIAESRFGGDAYSIDTTLDNVSRSNITNVGEDDNQKTEPEE